MRNIPRPFAATARVHRQDCQHEVQHDSYATDYLDFERWRSGLRWDEGIEGDEEINNH